MRPAFGIGSGTPYGAAIPQARDRRHPCGQNKKSPLAQVGWRINATSWHVCEQ